MRSNGIDRLKYRLLSGVCKYGVFASLILTPAAAIAQGTPDNSSSSLAETVVVTAEKRSEDIQDVPMSISAVSTDQLQSIDARNLNDIAALVPGLAINSQTGQPGSANVTIRGITTADLTSTTTAITVDDVPLGSSTSYAYAALSNLDLLPYDLDHIEVLKGPQGTLYGASALGGVVKYVTTTPNLDDFSGVVGGTVSSIDHGGTPGLAERASVNIPIISGQLGISLSGGQAYDPGYIDNIATGQKDFNHGIQDTARLTVLWKPDDKFTAKLTAIYNGSKFNGVGLDDYNPTTNQPAFGYYQNFFYEPFADQRSTSLFIADLSYDLNFATLTSVTGYSDMNSRVTYDASEIAYYDTTYTVNGILTPGQYTSRTGRLTEELRLASPDNQPLQWLVGGYYDLEHSRYDEFINAKYQATGQIDQAIAPFYNNDSPSGFEEEAIFGNLTYLITDNWDAGGGIRYARNDQHVEADTIGTLVGGGGPSPEYRSSDDSVTWALNSRYHIDQDVMFYARVATGYRPGGANTVAGVPPTFKPDTTINYEAGIKSDWFDHRLLFDLTGFYIDWSDIHLTDRLANQIPFIGNAGKAKSEGLELTSSYLITQELKLGVTGTYTDAYLETDAPAVGAFAGNPLPNTPKWSGVITLDWTHPLFDTYAANVGLAWRYVGPRQSDFPLSQGGDAHLADYNALDVTTGISNDQWKASLFFKNLTNNHGYLSYYNFGAAILQPRTIGLSLDYKF